MALVTFTPPIAASTGAKHTQDIKLLEADFGDGYSQPTPDGLNHIKRKLGLTWEALTLAQANTIKSFLVAQKGCIPFYYTPYGESTPVKWWCKVWDVTTNAGYLTVTAEFIQSFTLEV